jgi:hypothetical protein
VPATPNKLRSHSTNACDGKLLNSLDMEASNRDHINLHNEIEQLYAKIEADYIPETMSVHVDVHTFPQDEPATNRMVV